MSFSTQWAVYQLLKPDSPAPSCVKNGTVLFIHRSVGNIFEPKQMKREGNDKIEPSRFLHPLVVGQKTVETRNIILMVVTGFILFEIIEHIVIPMVFYFIKRKKKSVIGAESLPGEVVEIRHWKETEGQVIIKGELWRAVSDVTLKKGDKAIVKHVEGLTLKVEPLSNSSFVRTK